LGTTTNTSAQLGFLTPVSPAPLNDEALADLLATVVAGITGFDRNLVRPRWQRPTQSPHVGPTQPSFGTDWCAVGVTTQDPHDYPYEKHNSAGNGTDTLTSWSRVSVLVSFYGPNCQGNASVLRDGIYVAQNRDLLRTAGLVLRDAGTLTAVPDIENAQWVNRCDLPVTFEREIARIYNIENIISAAGTVVTDVGYSEPWLVPPKP